MVTLINNETPLDFYLAKKQLLEIQTGFWGRCEGHGRVGVASLILDFFSY